MAYFMGIDIGGTVVKAAIYDMDGKEVSVHGEKIKVLTPDHGMTERDMNEVRENTFRAIRTAVEKSGIADPSEIKGIGMTGQGNGAYMVDADGEPVWNGVMSSDARAKDYIKKWTSDGTYERIFPKIRNLMWTGQTSPIIAWFKDNHPEVLDKAKYVGSVKDYVRYLLTDVFCCEITEASSWDVVDMATAQYADDLFEELGIAEYKHIFPPIIDSCEAGGTVTAKAAELTGLAEGTPVVGGLFDISASILSAGVVKENQLGIIVGSWGINSILKKELVDDPKLFMQYFYGLPGVLSFMEGSSTSASNQEWFIDVNMERTDDIYARCGDMVAETPYKDTVFFLPFIYATNVNIDAKAAFIGLQGEHTQAHMMRALFEGVVFCHRMHIERLLPYCENPSVVRMAGGATRSKIWMQMFADILGLKVEISEAEELGAMGAALCAGVQAGAFSDLASAAEKWVKIRAVYEPDMEKHAYYQKKYAAYCAIIDAMDPVWGQIEELKK